MVYILDYNQVFNTPHRSSFPLSKNFGFTYFQLRGFPLDKGKTNGAGVATSLYAGVAACR